MAILIIRKGVKIFFRYNQGAIHRVREERTHFDKDAMKFLSKLAITHLKPRAMIIGGGLRASEMIKGVLF